MRRRQPGSRVRRQAASAPGPATATPPARPDRPGRRARRPAASRRRAGRRPRRAERETMRSRRARRPAEGSGRFPGGGEPMVPERDEAQPERNDDRRGQEKEGVDQADLPDQDGKGLVRYADTLALRNRRQRSMPWPVSKTAATARTRPTRRLTGLSSPIVATNGTHITNRAHHRKMLKPTKIRMSSLL